MKKPLFYSCDVETLGLELDSPIIEVGLCAVYYDTNKRKFTYRTRARVCSPGQNPVPLADLDAIPFLIESQQGRELLSEALACCPKTQSLDAVFDQLTYGEVANNPDAIWFFLGPQFDESMLRIQLTGTVPWKYNNVRCQRTLSKLLPVCTLKDEQAEHRAGPDAKAQARDVVNRLGHLFSSTPPNEWVL